MVNNKDGHTLYIYIGMSLYLSSWIVGDIWWGS